MIMVDESKGTMCEKCIANYAGNCYENWHGYDDPGSSFILKIGPHDTRGCSALVMKCPECNGRRLSTGLDKDCNVEAFCSNCHCNYLAYTGEIKERGNGMSTPDNNDVPPGLLEDEDDDDDEEDF